MQCWIILMVLITSNRMRLALGIDYEALERAWEQGDDPQELLSDDGRLYQQLDKIENDLERKQAGPQMVFVTLKGGIAKSEVASRWKEMLWNGGVDVNCYEMDEKDHLLIGLKHGRSLPELKKFLFDQPEIRQFEIDGRKFRVKQESKSKPKPKSPHSSEKSDL